MKKAFNLTVFLILVSVFAGCIEIVEEITFNKDGSGKVIYSFDMTHFYDYDTKISEEERKQKYDKALRNLDENNKELMDTLSMIEGIFNVKDKTDYKVFKPIIFFEFENVDALNRGLREMDIKLDEKQSVYEFDGKTLNRIDHLYKEKKNNSGVDEDEREAFKNYTYTTIIHLPSKVKSCDNDSAIVSKNKRTITNKVSLLDIMEGKTTLELNVTLK